jgi:hypothetical protein
MKIELEVTHTTQTEYDLVFPVYLQNGSDYYCYYDSLKLDKFIRLGDYSIGKSVDFFTDHENVKKILSNPLTKIISKETFQIKLAKILLEINGAVNEMYKADEQQ